MHRMKQKDKIKNIIIVVLCVTIIVMGIGFMFFYMKLDNYKKETNTFDVRFKRIKKLSSIKGGEKDPIGKIKIDSTGKIINMSFQLYQEHDEIDYEVTIKNEGTLEANIVSLFTTPDFTSKNVIKDIAPIVISISDVNGKMLEPGEETTVKISALYNREELSKEKNNPLKLSGKIGIITESSNES